MGNVRIRYFDIAKGIAILLVIMGHSVRIEVVSHFIFSFHMPLFFLISGFFFKKRPQEICIKINAKRLLVPYICTCIGVILFHVLFLVCTGKADSVVQTTARYFFASLYGSGADQQSPFYIPQIGAVWFLLALFFVLIIFNSIVELKYYFAVVLILAYVGYKTSQFLWLPFSIQSALVSLFFFAVGYECRRNHLLEKKISVWWIGVIFSVWVLAFLYGGQLNLVSCYFGNGLFDIIGALCGSYIVLRFSMLLEKVTFVNHLMEFIGRNTLPILCFHLIELNTFPWGEIREMYIQSGFGYFGLFALTVKYAWVFLMLGVAYLIPAFRKIYGINS